MEWDEEAIERLWALWAEGLPAAEIGRRMGISKNAVVGKAHRLNLTARPSPIHAAAEPRPAQPKLDERQAVARAATALPAPRPMPVVVVSPPAVRSAATQAELRQVATAVTANVVARLAAAVRRRPVCCWPIGEPGTKSFRFCDVDAIAGKPYCEEHASLAYVKVRDKREDAA